MQTSLPKRKPNRLPDFDYRAPGTYFITICTADKRHVLSEITVGEGLAPPENRLSAVGVIVKEQVLDLGSRYPSVTIDNFVMMPNHIHLLVSLAHTEASGGTSPSPTVPDLVRTVKSISARLSRTECGVAPLWQRSYHEHIVRNERDYLEIWQYIDNNPARWSEDRYAR